MNMEKKKVTHHLRYILLLLFGGGMILSGCSPKTGVVNFTSEPGVANIYVNEKLRGVTGNVQSEYLTLRLEYGIYQIHAQKTIDAGSEYFGERVVVVDGSGDQWVNLELRSRPTLQALALKAEGATIKEPVKKEQDESEEDRPRPPMLGEWVMIPGGAFVMGTADGPIDERPERIVVVPPFRMMATEVTFACWDQCVRDGGCSYSPNDEGWGRGRRPVINVSYRDITQQFIPWLNNKTQREYMLPSEAQWEYASRAGTETEYYWGDDPIDELANCSECGSEWDGLRTAPVKSFPPNPFGLYDMAGNVWEWVEDCWNDNHHGAPEHSLPRYDGECNQRVLRGGSWGIGVTRLRSAYRNWSEINRRNIDVGFRLVENLKLDDWVLDDTILLMLPELDSLDDEFFEALERVLEPKESEVRSSQSKVSE